MKYLQIEYKTGNLFQYSKEEKEGFEKHVSSKDNVSYRNYHKNVLEGDFNGVELDKNTPIGAQIKVLINNTNLDDNVMVQIPLYNSKGNIDRNYATSLIRFLPNLSLGDHIKFYSFSLETDQGNTIKGVSIKDGEGKKLERLSMSYYDKEKGEVVKGDVPTVEKVGEDALGKPRFDATKKEDFLAEVLADNLKTSGKIPENNPTTNEPIEKEENEESDGLLYQNELVPNRPPSRKQEDLWPTKQEEEEGDDLPF